MKYNRKNRAIVSGILVGLASIAAIAVYFDLEMNEVNRFLVGTVLFFIGIVALAALCVVVVKGLGKLLGRGRDDGGGPPESGV